MTLSQLCRKNYCQIDSLLFMALKSRAITLLCHFNHKKTQSSKRNFSDRKTPLIIVKRFLCFQVERKRRDKKNSSLLIPSSFM